MMTLPDVYTAAFETERAHVYPMIDAVEAREGFALDRDRLEGAARVLACPVKAHAPNWQHGRVIYAVAKRLLWDSAGPVLLLDIGTAKGFSALCLAWARVDAGASGHVESVDVIDPSARVLRNSLAELTGPKTLSEFVAPWPEAHAIVFAKQTGMDWLRANTDRVQVAFVDGKHSHEVVAQEGALLAACQESGDVAIFDDVQIPGVATAVKGLKAYQVEYVAPLPTRIYAIARRR